MPPENNEQNHTPPATPPTPTNPVSENPKPTSYIHTLEGDIFSAVKDENYSNNIVKIATEARTPSKDSSSDNTLSGFPYKKIIIFVSVIIVMLAAGAVAYYMFRSTTPPPTDSTATTTPNNNPSQIENISLLGAEAVVKINIKDLNKFQAVGLIQQAQRELRNKKIAPNTAIELDLDINSTEFFQKNQYSGGEGLLRSLSPEYSFGLFNNKENIFESFLIFKINNYDVTFASMLQWEGYLPVDFKDMFTDVTVKERLVAATLLASSTATTSTSTIIKTPNPPAPTLVQAGFKDAVLKNTDARIYYNTRGEVEFVYGFINKDYLIITGGTESFIDIKTRLLNRNILR